MMISSQRPTVIVRHASLSAKHYYNLLEKKITTRMDVSLLCHPTL